MSQAARPISMDEARMVVPAWDEGEEEAFVRVLSETVGTLEREGVPYVLMGGIGSATHGRPRWTHDIDVFLRPEDAKRALVALEACAFEVEETYPDWLFKAFKSDVMVDLIFKSSRGILLDEEMIRRAERIEFKGVEVLVIPPEDLIVIKAVVHDEHMPRHWHDALAILAVCNLDWDYLVQRSRQYGARRVLSLLLYAQSNDLIVPAVPIRRLFEELFAE